MNLIGDWAPLNAECWADYAQNNALWACRKKEYENVERTKNYVFNPERVDALILCLEMVQLFLENIKRCIAPGSPSLFP